MASYPPPTANLQIFNPTVFDTEDVALSLADANKLYAKKSGAIFYGPIAAPSLSLGGVSVGNKLNEIDANTAKLTDIIYNSNTTQILNDLSVIGVLKLPDLPNTRDTIVNNKQKTTKISYDIGGSMTTIGDTLKASGTLIVGSNNYNASDQFEKLQNISKSGDTLTIDDSIFLTGNLRLPNFVDVNGQMLVYEKKLTDITFDDVLLITEIANNFEIAGNFKLNTIPNVEQKIIDISNTLIPYITYDSGGDKLDVEKDMDLGINNLTCNFMRPTGNGYGLSQNWAVSYLEFRNGGHHLDAFNADGTGRPLYLNFYGKSDIQLGSWTTNSTTHINGNLNITENNGTSPSVSGGSLTLIHNDPRGKSSIVFKSQVDSGTDYGYISYQDDFLNISNKQRGLLEFGIQNNGVGEYIDNIAMMPSGYVGINTREPQVMLDVNGDTNITGNLQLGSITDVEDAINNAGGVPSITYDDLTQTTTFSGNSVVMPQLTITPAEPFANVAQEIYSKHGDINGVAELKLGNDNGISKTFANVLKSENGNATFYGNNGSETKYMEYNSVDDRIYIHKDTQLTSGNLYIDKIQIEEPIGTVPNGQKGSLTLVHGDSGGTSSIVFRSNRDSGIDHGYISYTDDYPESLSLNRSLLEIGCKNDSGATTIDNIALMASGFVGVNTQTPQTTLDVNGEIGCNGMTMNNVIIGERELNSLNGNGVMVKTLLNPASGSSASAGSIFEVQSEGLSKRLWVGQYITSPAKNRFMFGFTGADGTEGLETNYLGGLGVDGSVECTEIKVNKIPLNSFTNFTFLYNFTTTTDPWGRGHKLDVLGGRRCYSHNPQFRRVSTSILCSSSEYFGTYLIKANVMFKNNGTGRVNPVLSIGINNDTVKGEIGEINTSPNWDTALTDGYCQHNIFSAQYTRMDQGEVSSLSCSRIYRFTNTTDRISLNTFIGNTTDESFTSELLTYKIFNAGVSIRYLGNFDEPILDLIGT